MIVVMMPSEDQVRARLTLMDQATAVANMHVPAGDGFCAGCMQMWSRWVPSSGCTHVIWARSVLETHGVDDDAWDIPARVRLGAAVAA